jgi:hypothetical protein
MLFANTSNCGCSFLASEVFSGGPIEMKKNQEFWVFFLAGLYDCLIGLTFLVAGSQLFKQFNVPAPNHWGYIQFGSLMLMIFGLMFFSIAFRPIQNRNLIPFGILLKLSYISLTTYYWATSGLPGLFQPFVLIDAVMLVLFILAYRSPQTAAN